MQDYLSILREFEESKDRFVYEAIRSRLNAIYENYSDLDSEYWSELLAFSYSENQENNPDGYGAFYGPMCILIDKDGLKVPHPPFDSITAGRLACWEERSQKSIHPYLKLRYLGLVIEFKKRITGERVRLDQFEEYVQLALQIIDEEFIERTWEKYDLLKRCLSISIKINSERLKEEIKRRYFSIDVENSPHTLYRCFDDLLWNPGATLADVEKRNIIEKITNIIDQIGSDSVEKIDPDFFDEGISRLCEFYNRTNEREKLKETLLKYCSIVEKLASKLPAVFIVAYWERLLTLYLKYGFKEETQQVLKEIETRSPEILAEMKGVGSSGKIPKEFVDNLKEIFGKGSDKEALQNFAESFIPDYQREVENLRNLRSELPLLYHLTYDSYDGNTGRRVAQIGSGDEDFDGKLVEAISQSMIASSPLLRELLDFLLFTKKIETDSLLQFLNESPIFPKSISAFIGRSIEHFKKKEFDTFVYNAIPQIENLLRDLLKTLGGSTWKVKDESYHLKNLEELLRDPLIVNFLGIDIASYFRILFIDGRGWNLRNNILHGILLPELISPDMAYRVFHALICLGHFPKETKIDVESLKSKVKEFAPNTYALLESESDFWNSVTDKFSKRITHLSKDPRFTSTGVPVQTTFLDLIGLAYQEDVYSIKYLEFIDENVKALFLKLPENLKKKALVSVRDLIENFDTHRSFYRDRLGEICILRKLLDSPNHEVLDLEKPLGDSKPLDIVIKSGSSDQEMFVEILNINMDVDRIEDEEKFDKFLQGRVLNKLKAKGYNDLATELGTRFILAIVLWPDVSYVVDIFKDKNEDYFKKGIIFCSIVQQGDRDRKEVTFKFSSAEEAIQEWIKFRDTKK